MVVSAASRRGWTAEGGCPYAARLIGRFANDQRRTTNDSSYRYNVEVKSPSVRQIASADFPTRWGKFRIHGFVGEFGTGDPLRKEEAVALVMGDVQSSPPLVRIHSQCLTGDVFASLRCDCRQQLEMALSMIADEGAGILIYEQQEGRGIGLMAKLQAYELQDGGLDTVEANERLGFKADHREFALPGEILKSLGVSRGSVALQQSGQSCGSRTRGNQSDGTGSVRGGGECSRGRLLKDKERQDGTFVYVAITFLATRRKADSSHFLAVRSAARDGSERDDKVCRVAFLATGRSDSPFSKSALWRPLLATMRQSRREVIARCRIPAGAASS